MRWMIVAYLAVALPSTAVLACPPYVPIDDVEAARYEQTLKNSERTTADKIFAFDKLKCADKPHWRTEAIDLMFAQQSWALRGHALATVLFSRDRVILQFINAPPGKGKEQVLLLVQPKSSENCVSIHSPSGTAPNRPCGSDALTIDGTTVRSQRWFAGHLTPSKRQYLAWHSDPERRAARSQDQLV